MDLAGCVVTPTPKCHRCQSPLLEGAAAGLCPRCLGLLAFGDPTHGQPRGNTSTYSFGDYELLDEIARGGMGVVYRAKQVSLNRLVALKVVLHGPFASEEFRRRFRTEAEAVAGLRHPNIVSIYEAGEFEGNPYLAMEYVKGQTLAEVVREKPLPAQRAAKYMRAIAEAVRHAHESGVLHRDLKPSNVLLDAQDEPRITDFGLAKLLKNDSRLTTTGQVLGSPSHMPPEQAASNLREVGPAGDIYSLGAMLYHLLTGRPPFQGDTLQEILLQVASTEPIPPQRLNPSLPLDLQTICLKCLQKDPGKRYPSARELAEELTRYLNGEPILARPVGWVEQSIRWCRRKPALAGSIGAGIAFFLVIAIGSPIAIYRIERALKAAEEAKRLEIGSRIRAESAEQRTQQQMFAALIGQARATVRSGEMGQRIAALDALRQAVAISNSVELRRDVFAALALPDLKFKGELAWGPEYTLRRMDPTFQRIALCKDRGPVEIRATVDQALLATLPATTNLPVFGDTHWSRDGNYLAVKRDREGTGTLAEWEIWDLSASKPRLALVIHDAYLEAVAFHPDGRRIAAATVDRSLRIWDLSSGLLVSRMPQTNIAYRLIFDGDGGRFALMQQSPAGSLLSVHSIANGAAEMTLLISNHVNHLDWSPDGHWISAPDNSGKVTLVDARSGERIILGRHKAAAMEALFSRNGEYLMSGGWGYEVQCWNLHTMRRAMSVPIQGFNLQIRGDGQQCAMETQAGVQVLDWVSTSGYREFGEDLGGRVSFAAFSADGRWLAAAGMRHMGVWDLARGGAGALTNGAPDLRLTFTEDGQLFTDRRGEWTRWRILPGTESMGQPRMERLPGIIPAGFVSLSIWSNAVILTGTRGSTVAGMDQLEAPSLTWKPTVDGLNCISRDGRWLAMFSSFTPNLHVYRLPGLENIATLSCRANISEFDFAPDNHEIGIASDQAIEFWDTSTWSRTRELPGFTWVSYDKTSHGAWLRHGSSPGLYRLDSGAPLLPLPQNTIPLAVSPDGLQLALSVDGERLQLWNLPEIRRQLSALGMDWEDRQQKLQMESDPVGP